MVVRVAFVSSDNENMWARDIVEWSRPLPREDEYVLFTLLDHVIEDGQEPKVNAVYWPIQPCNADVFISISGPDNLSDAEFAEWLAKHGFQIYSSPEAIEEYCGLPGLAEVTKEHDQKN